MNFNNEDEVLALFSRLLERLHQADGDHHNSSSPFTLIYVAKGAQNVGSIQNQYMEPSHAPQRGGKTVAKGHATLDRDGDLPDALRTDEAMLLWQKAQWAGYVDDHYQPKVSRTKAAMIANAMAVRLGIRNKWKLFETLWHRQNMYQDYYEALNQQQSLEFQDSLNAVFG